MEFESRARRETVSKGSGRARSFDRSSLTLLSPPQGVENEVFYPDGAFFRLRRRSETLPTLGRSLPAGDCCAAIPCASPVLASCSRRFAFTDGPPTISPPRFNRNGRSKANPQVRLHTWHRSIKVSVSRYKKSAVSAPDCSVWRFNVHFLVPCRGTTLFRVAVQVVPCRGPMPWPSGWP